MAVGVASAARDSHRGRGLYNIFPWIFSLPCSHPLFSLPCSHHSFLPFDRNTRHHSSWQFKFVCWGRNRTCENRTCPDPPTLACFLKKKTRETPRKNKGFSLFAKPRNSLEKKGKTPKKKPRAIGKQRKQGNRKKQGLEGQGCEN